MSLRLSRALWRLGLAGTTLGLACVATLTAVPASASPSSASASASATDPYLPSNGHVYRHGAIPTMADQVKIKNWNAEHPTRQGAGGSTGPDTMYYNGGIGGAGAVTSTPKVYLVFWGTQWGTQASDVNGDLTLSADHDNGAPYLQDMFKNLGTGNELWSGTMTQYCDGSLVATGATACPSGAPHVGYPSGNALVGVWYDNTSAAPSPSTQGQIAAEAIAAAKHFGNSTSSSNRYAQYVVLSAPGTDPDSFLTSNWCAWHDYTTSSVGNIAYTNMPYVMDDGAACGQGFVNSPGTLDGYSIVEGHEYAETVTDQFPSYGWLSRSGSEVGDECAWISPGSPGGAADVTMGTGSYSMQSTWSNDTNSCAISHAVVTGTGSTGNTVTVANPGYTEWEGRHPRQPAGPGQRLGLGPDVDLHRDRPARRTFDQLGHGADHGYADHREYLQRDRHGNRHDRREGIGLLLLDDQPAWQHRHGEQPRLAELPGELLGEPAAPGQRLRLGPIADLHRHRPAGRAVDQHQHRSDFGDDVEHSEHLQREGHGHRHHRSSGVGIVLLDHPQQASPLGGPRAGRAATDGPAVRASYRARCAARSPRRAFVHPSDRPHESTSVVSQVLAGSVEGCGAGHSPKVTVNLVPPLASSGDSARTVAPMAPANSATIASPRPEPTRRLRVRSAR